MSKFQTEWFSIDPSMTWDEMMEVLDRREKQRYEIQQREQKEHHEMQSRIQELESALANAWSAFNALSTSSRVEVATAGFVAQSILTDAIGHERLRELIRDGNLDGYEQWQTEYRKRISEDSEDG